MWNDKVSEKQTVKRQIIRLRGFLSWVLMAIISPSLAAHDLVELVKKVSPSVVGVGYYDPLGAPRANLLGSGFAVGDGTLIATNYHVVSKPLKENSQQRRVVFIGKGSSPKTAFADIVAFDEEHDLALLKIQVTVPPLPLAENAMQPEGTSIAFVGFPIGAVLGLYPAVHEGIVSAHTPVINPTEHSSRLNPATIRRLRNPYFVYQLDATAYPGNSGSGVVNTQTGEVMAVINKVFVKTTKETVLSDPSGITYAIPVQFLSELMKEID